MIDKILDILQRIKEIFVFDIKCNSLVFILIIVFWFSVLGYLDKENTRQVELLKEHFADKYELLSDQYCDISGHKSEMCKKRSEINKLVEKETEEFFKNLSEE